MSFHTTASDPWVGVRCRNLRRRNIRLVFFSFLYRMVSFFTPGTTGTDFLFVTLDLMVHDPGWDALFYFSCLFKYLANHSLESTHFWTNSTIHSWLPFYGFRPLGQYPRVGLDVKAGYYLGLTFSL